MHKPFTILWLSLLIAVGAIVAAAIGLLAGGGGGAFEFTTLRGTSVTIYGTGLYRFDTLLIGSGFRGGDAVTLFVGVPVLLAALWLYRRGSLRGGLLLAGVLTHFLYIYASLALGAAYNPLFLLYIALFAASLFALGAVVTAIRPETLAAHVRPSFPRRAVAIFMIVIAFVLLIVWLGLTWLPSALSGTTAALVESYTTLITYVLDLGLIVPFAVLTAMWLFQRKASGYIAAAIMLNVSWLIGTTIAASTVAQVLAGYPFSGGQLIGLVAPFVLMTGVGGWLTWRFFKAIGDTPVAVKPMPGSLAKRSRATRVVVRR